MNDPAPKDPIDKNALVFVICAGVFLCSLIYVIARNDVSFSPATSTVSGSGAGAPGSNPKDNPEKK